ncbi:MAG: hypothetical protein WBW73_13330 [Rhodoplanes sp.]
MIQQLAKLRGVGVQAGHMAAADRLAEALKSLCQGASTYGPRPPPSQFRSRKAPSSAGKSHEDFRSALADTFVKKGKAAARNARMVGDLFNQSARYFIRSDPLPPRRSDSQRLRCDLVRRQLVESFSEYVVRSRSFINALKCIAHEGFPFQPTADGLRLPRDRRRRREASLGRRASKIES